MLKRSAVLPCVGVAVAGAVSLAVFAGCNGEDPTAQPGQTPPPPPPAGEQPLPSQPETGQPGSPQLPGDGAGGPGQP